MDKINTIADPETISTPDMRVALNLLKYVYEVSGDYEMEEPPKVLTAENCLKFAAMAEITQESRVLDIFGGFSALTATISYMYEPEILVSMDLHFPGSSSKRWHYDVKRNWEHTTDLLGEYPHTTPEFLTADASALPFPEKSFDVIIGDFPGPSSEEEKRGIYRFGLSAEQTYDLYEKVVSQALKLLEVDGRLVLLVRPHWLYKCWQLLDEKSLKLEYPAYSLPLSDESSPNSPIGIVLRKVPKTESFAADQKRALHLFLRDNGIDREDVTKSGYIYPYEKPVRRGNPLLEQNENHAVEQYFFREKTVKALVNLCSGRTACFLTPSIAAAAVNEQIENIVLFDKDNRFRNKVPYVRYDLTKGLNELTKKHAGKYETVICDPPFSQVKPSVLARDIDEIFDRKSGGSIYIVYPAGKSGSLINEMKNLGYEAEEVPILIEYSEPPRMLYRYGADAVRLYKFRLKE